MTSICGTFQRDGRPATPMLLRRLVEAAPHRGAARTTLVRGPLAMAELRIGPAHAARRVAEPNRRRACAIVMAGRLDNRHELMDRLGVRDRTGRAVAADFREPFADDASDSGLVLRAYEVWGEECANHLAGDFAFAIWDETRRAVHLVRDAVGVKPLCYYVDSGRLVWASEVRQVLGAEILVAPNPAFAAECLAFDIRSRTETLYKNVQRLPPGHWLTVEARRTRSARYFVLEQTPELRYEADADYADRFRDLLEEAVSSRANGCSPVAAFLSGGVDSSSVVCTARALGHHVETFSLLFPDLPEADERQFIADVVGHARVGTAHAQNVGRATIAGSAYRARAVARRDLLELPGDAVAVPLLSAMRKRGFDAALSGAGGDHGFTGSSFHYADLLERRQWRALWRQVAADRRTMDVGWSAAHLLTHGLRPLLPQQMRAALAPLVRAVTRRRDVPRHIGAGFATEVSLADRLRRSRTPSGMPESRAHVCRLFDDGWTAWLLECGERTGAEQGVDVRHPFFDRRLVEFAAAIPESQRWRDTTTKYVVRQALRDHLPPAVYSREGKADGSMLVVWAVAALGGRRALSDLSIASLGWVETSELLALHDNAHARLDSGTGDYCGGLFTVWVALTLDAWYRAEFVEGPNHGSHDRPVNRGSDLFWHDVANRGSDHEAVLSATGVD